MGNTMAHSNRFRSLWGQGLLVIAFGLFGSSCSNEPPPVSDSPRSADGATATLKTDAATVPAATPQAKVVAVDVIPGADNGYTFGVTVVSPDTGCDQYANWWEVLNEDGELLYRRILAHSHVDEQPFRRTGGPVVIEPQQPVMIRVHMDPQGYSNQAQQGTAATGFEAVTLPEGFAADLATAEPQPQSCAF